MVQDGNNVVITDQGNTITILNVSLSDMNADDFIFDF